MNELVWKKQIGYIKFDNRDNDQHFPNYSQMKFKQTTDHYLLKSWQKNDMKNKEMKEKNFIAWHLRYPNLVTTIILWLLM